MADNENYGSAAGKDVGEGIYESHNVENQIIRGGLSSADDLKKMVLEIREEMRDGDEVNFVETGVDGGEPGLVLADDDGEGNNLLDTAVEDLFTEDVDAEGGEEVDITSFLNTSVDSFEADTDIEIDEDGLILADNADVVDTSFIEGVQTAIEGGADDVAEKATKIETLVKDFDKVSTTAVKVVNLGSKAYMAGMRFGKNANKVINGNQNVAEAGGEQIKTAAKFAGRNFVGKPAKKIGSKVSKKIMSKPTKTMVKKVGKLEAKLTAKLAKTSSKILNKIITFIIKMIAKLIAALGKVALSSFPMFAILLCAVVIIVFCLSVFGGTMEDDQFTKYVEYMQEEQEEFQETTLEYYNDGYKVDGTYNGVSYINFQAALSILQAIQPDLNGSNSEFDFLDEMKDAGLFYTITETTTSEYVLEEAEYDEEGNVIKEEVTTTVKYVVTVSSLSDYEDWVSNNYDIVKKFCDKEDIAYTSDMNEDIFANAETLYASDTFSLMLEDAGISTSLVVGTVYDTGEHSGVLAYPTSYRTMSATYPYYSDGSEHTGVDFPCPTGTYVCACADGVVVEVKELTYSYGKYVVIKHEIDGQTLYTLYAHNSQLAVEVGDTVVKGQVIALSGSTGNSTGPHLHLSVLTSWSPQNYVNPLDYLE